VGRAIEEQVQSLRDKFVGTETSCAAPVVVDAAFVDEFAPASNPAARAGAARAGPGNSVGSIGVVVGAVVVVGAWFGVRSFVAFFAAAVDFGFGNVPGRLAPWLLWLSILSIFCRCNNFVQTAPIATSFGGGVPAVASTNQCGAIVLADLPAASS